MVVYVAVVLLATVAALPAGEPDDDLDLAAILWGAAAGLAAAHWFAFHMASALYAGGSPTRPEVRAGVVQVAAALTVALLATIPQLFLGDEGAASAAVLVLSAIIGGVGYAASRRTGARRLGALLRAAATLGVGAVVVAVKVALEH